MSRTRTPGGRKRPGASSVWPLRRLTSDPNVRNLIVRATQGNEIVISDIRDWERGLLTVSRDDARLLAKRINECLDATRII